MKNHTIKISNFTVNSGDMQEKEISTARLQKYYLGKNYPGIYLTTQEAKCMYYFLSGMTNLEVAKKINLSARTVTYYCCNIKCKLASSTKSELIEKIKTTDFIKYLKEMDS